MTESGSTARKREFALDVVRKLRSSGFQALFAGGCVRDLLLGHEPSDFDVATDARPEQVIPLFRKICEVGMSFGVVRVIGSRKVGDVEVATFRSDGAYLDGRRPETVVFSSPAEDAARRDFTINGMFLDPIDDRVIDYVGGRADLDAGILRAIGNPYERFSEDKLRLLRAARFAARFGFEIEPATWAALHQMAESVTVVAAERIAQELRKMLTHRSRAEGMRLTEKSGLLDAILPPVAALAGVDDLWNQTLRVLDALPQDLEFALAFAALVHQVGKPATRQIDETGSITYPAHEQLGRRLCETLGRTLKLSNDEIERSCWLVLHQHSLWGAREMPDSSLKRLLGSAEIADLIVLHRAVGSALGIEHDTMDYVDTYLREQPNGPINPPPLVTGHDLMQAGLKPGPKFSEYLHEIRTAQLDRVVNTKEEALAWLASRTG